MFYVQMSKSNSTPFQSNDQVLFSMTRVSLGIIVFQLSIIHVISIIIKLLNWAFNIFVQATNGISNVKQIVLIKFS